MRLRKFNEGKEVLDVDYIKECFIELFDDESLDGEVVGDDDNFISFGFDIPMMSLGVEYSMSHLLVMSDEINEFFKKSIIH